MYVARSNEQLSFPILLGLTTEFDSLTISPSGNTWYLISKFAKWMWFCKEKSIQEKDILRTTSTQPLNQISIF